MSGSKDTKVGAVARFYCSECGGLRNCDILGHHAERGNDEGFGWWKDWYLLKCRGCNYAFACSVYGDSETYTYEIDEDGETVPVGIEEKKYFPALSKRTRPGWVNEIMVLSEHDNARILEHVLFEVYSALDADLRMLSAIGIRTAFDVSSIILGAHENLPFEAKLSWLADNKHIREAEKDALSTIVDGGNASAHRGWRPSLSDIEIMMEVLENFIHQAFVVPARHKESSKALARLRIKVPPKKTNSKKTSEKSEEAS